MKIFAIDYGKKRVGLAVSDPTEQIALALPLYMWKDDGNDSARLAELSIEQESEEIVVGLPINMDDTVGPAARRVLDFIEELKQFVSVPVVPWDERLSSAEAEDRLRGLEMGHRKKREHVNTVAAQVILETYMQNRRNR